MLSIIIPSYNSGDRITRAYEKLSVLMESECIPFEFVVIDDGSSDSSFQVAKNLEREYNNVFAFQLSKNFGSNYAAFAGLSVCNGDCATIVPDDEQQPYFSLVEMYRLWEKGHRIIIPYRAKRNGEFAAGLAARISYWIVNRFTDVIFPKGGADTFFIDREVVNIINQRRNQVNRALVSEILGLGFNPVFVPYERHQGINGKSRWTFAKKSRYLSDLFFSNSKWPVKAVFRTGVVFLLTSVVFLTFGLTGVLLIWFNGVPGWILIMMMLGLFFSGILLVALGIIAEYLWRVFDSVNGRAGYIIRKKSDET